MAICQYTFQIDRLIWIQGGPLSDLFFQRTFPIKITKIVSDILADAFKEMFAQWQASRCRKASPEYE